MVDEYGQIVCENCGSDQVISEYYEDGAMHMCTVCGRSVTCEDDERPDEMQDSAGVQR